MNYYELLGVDNNATKEIIKKAYLEQIKMWHPDVNKDKDALSITIKLNDAKKTLLDDEKRKEYDEFIKTKEEETYKKYSEMNVEKEEKKNKFYEEKMVTKWEYLNEYLKSNNIKLYRKILSLVLVLIESLICSVLKYIIILLSFICFIVSDIIQIIFNYLVYIVIILLCYVFFIGIKQGFQDIINNHIIELRIILVIIVSYITSFILKYIGGKLLSQKVFDFLYNKLDVFLFKISVR